MKNSVFTTAILACALGTLTLGPATSWAQQVEECNHSVVQGGTDDEDDGDGDGEYFNSLDPFAAGADPDCFWWGGSEADPIPSGDTIKPRIVVIFDTSGSMLWNVCDADSYIGGDGSLECPGVDVDCNTCAAEGCGNGLPDDSRMYKTKEGVANAIAAFGEIEWSLMRFQQSTRTFQCDSNDAGGWGGGCGGGEVLVSFAPENTPAILTWMDHEDNQAATNSSGRDFELRPDGSTPLAGAMGDANDYLDDVKAADSASACRPYHVILVTDGLQSGTCPGTPTTAAATLFNAGVPVSVIGFATSDAGIITGLNDIADHGHNGLDDGSATAILANNSADLSNGIAAIVASLSLVEVACNLLDDDCDGNTDEGFPSEYWEDPEFPPNNETLGPVCDVGQGVCAGQGTMECVDNLAPFEEFQCSVAAGAPNCTGVAGGGLACCDTDSGNFTECCNGLDDDCDGATDEDTGGACICLANELCNGIDDDCDGFADESPPDMPGEGSACLTGQAGIGICTSGITDCVAGGLDCIGGQGPIAETCDGRDENCNTVSDTDELDRSCFTGTGWPNNGCDPNDPGNCLGNCSHGVEECLDMDLTAGEDWQFGGIDPNSGNPALAFCVGEVLPGTEDCNGADDDCDDLIDEDFNVGGMCTIVTDTGAPGVPLPGANCTANGFIVCDSDGNAVCDAIPVPSVPEVCDDIDNDCDGLVDETLGAPVGTSCGATGGGCGTGTFECNNGALECVFDGTPVDEICDGINNDCDMFIDEEFPFQGSDCTDDPLAFDPPAPNGDVGLCEYGSLICENGTLVCDGFIGPGEEICDGLDNDCDGEADNMATCPTAGDLCVEGQCAFKCTDNEFPCPFGFVCDQLDDGTGTVDGFCVPDPCTSITCDPGFVCVSETGTCSDLCEGISCLEGAICNGGFCIDCFQYDCDEGEVCVTSSSGAGVCETDLCAGVECEANAFCQEGVCVSLSCDPECGADERCLGGECIVDRCLGKSCNEGTVCNPDTGQCSNDPCEGVVCVRGEVCQSSSGACISDPCVQIDCPDGLVCLLDFEGGGSCGVPSTGGDWIAPGGGGGGCSTSSGSTQGGSAAFLMLALVALRRRRRHRRDS